MYQDPQEQERARFQKRRTDESIAMAMESRWEEAAQANRDIIAMMPSDHHAYNRLGKSLMELGQYAESRDSYNRAQELDSTNVIAKKNLARLAALGEEGPAEPSGQKLSPHMFIAETGRTGIAILEGVAEDVAARLTPGDQVDLRRTDGSLTAHTARGERIEEVGPPLGLRLSNLMDAGNLYAAAVVSVEGTQCRIIIREVYQDPSQEGRLSFPASGATPGESVRPYTRARPVRNDRDAEQDFEMSSEDDWDDTERGGGGGADADADAETPLPGDDADADADGEFDE